MLKFKLEQYTPQLAQAELDKAKAAGFINRHVRDARVQMYKGAIARGGWETDTGEVVKYAWINGQWVMIDGQHRLTAIVAANQPVMLWSAYGVKPESFVHLDQGQPRVLSDVLLLKGWGEYAGMCSNAGRMLWKEDSSGSPFERPDGDEVLGDGDIAQYIEDNYRPALLDFAGKYKKMLHQVETRSLGGKSWMTYVGFRIAAIDSNAWDGVLVYLSDPTVQPPHPAWGWATDHVRDVRRAYEAESPAGKLHQGRNRDMTDATIRAYRAAWEFQRTRRACRTKSALKNAIKAAGTDWIPFDSPVAVPIAA